GIACAGYERRARQPARRDARRLGRSATCKVFVALPDIDRRAFQFPQGPRQELPMRRANASALVVLFLGIVANVGAQAPGKWPPDSLINTKVIPKNTPPIQVVGTMRNFAGDLGLRCQFSHVGREGQPLQQFDFASDEKRTKQVARQMMAMVAEINRRVDSLPGRASPGLQVTCATCHRGVSRPVPLSTLIADAAMAGGADS